MICRVFTANILFYSLQKAAFPTRREFNKILNGPRKSLQTTALFVYYLLNHGQNKNTTCVVN